MLIFNECLILKKLNDLNRRSQRTKNSRMKWHFIYLQSKVRKPRRTGKRKSGSENYSHNKDRLLISTSIEVQKGFGYTGYRQLPLSLFAHFLPGISFFQNPHLPSKWLKI